MGKNSNYFVLSNPKDVKDERVWERTIFYPKSKNQYRELSFRKLQDYLDKQLELHFDCVYVLVGAMSTKTIAYIVASRLEILVYRVKDGTN